VPEPVSFAALLAEETGTRKGPRCAVALLLADLGDEDRPQVEAALGNSRVTTSAIVAALGRMGREIGDSSVQRHRRGGCRCRSTTN
jgi:hypothetical protein